MTQRVELANRNYADLAPFFAQKLTSAIDDCVSDGYLIRLFEGFRSIERQRWLYASGRTRPGSIVTHAKAGQSWHQLGVACDVVGYAGGHWDWSIDYDKIDVIFKAHGFESLKFERAHKQIRGGLTIAQAQRIVANESIEALWSQLENYK
jgi:peptidoglycan LD-endopeptidase CwlK